MTTNFNLNELVRDNVKAMKPYSSARDEFKAIDGDQVFLDANENPFENGLNRYPDPQQGQLKAALSKLKNIAVEHILLGNGSDEVLDLIFRAFCEPNKDNIISVPPTYGMYGVLANLNAIENREIPLDPDFELDLDNISRATSTHTKLIFICAPNNPTANTFAPNAIENLLKTFNGIVVIDEAYIDFSKHKSWTSRLEDFTNLIVTQTLSKAYGMAGIRLGICYASAEIIAILNKIKPPYNINELTQQKALERLSHPEKVTEEIQKILKQRTWLISKLKQNTIIETVYPSDANFVLAKVDDANKRYDQLITQGIVVRNRSNQPGCENCLRFTVGTQFENIKLVKALEDIAVI